MIYPYNKNQQYALFTFKLFQYLTSTCFEQAYCSSSEGTAHYRAKHNRAQPYESADLQPTRYVTSHLTNSSTIQH